MSRYGKYRKRLILLPVLAIAAMLTMGASGCNSGTTTASDKAKTVSDQLQGHIYQAKHNIDFRNYNLKNRVTDDPSTILWCTFFPPGVQSTSNGSTPGQAFTVPIAGKLTSSNKRPYQANYYNSDNNAFEQPAPDHMFGSSSEYRYGFDPTLAIYSDFTNMASYCTTSPTVWQAQNTQIVVQTQKALTNLSEAASASIRAGNPEKALALLKQAETTQKELNK